ncbi:RNA-directed DNA polymerase (reversetranscriptase)-related family protein [Striga asiatica]|uniref:RNA-directed DNA polymerase (Reversetranscriptase)-related family protein n=1 Tax=Striga asiatica TaxID=4170 RepID=A0A5A7PBB8_STRAF|nr:RNA-directed DNA polymerase (reversetranscriptase)-related family protein [Striga asiatica]
MGWAIFVYASTDPVIREEQWLKLCRDKSQWGHTWFLGGDFNDIASNSEKRGGNFRTQGSLRAFNSFIQNMGMEDIPFIGHPFTWSNNRQGDDFIEERIDRVFSSPMWALTFPKSQVTHIPLHSSDHCLLLLNTDCEDVKAKQRFYFDSRWVSKEGFSDTVAEAWNLNSFGVDLYSIQARIRNVRIALLKWKKSMINHSKQEIDLIKAQLHDQHLQGPHKNWAEWESNRRKLHQAYAEEERFWAQKARCLWLKEGDRNTKYFQACVKQRRRTNSIEGLLKRDGSRCQNSAEILEEVQSYFSKLFSTSNPTLDWCSLDGIPCSITEEMNNRLVRPVTMEELKQALWEMHPNKAPGIDGMSPHFFQSSWNTIKDSLFHAIQQFFLTGKMPKATNLTVITLIPKKPNAQSLSEFRPISLCTVTYRIISKILANRLKQVLSVCISPHQAAFVPGRQLIDNFVIANECIHLLNSKRKGKNCFMALKLDMMKAFDRVEWKFLAAICKKMGFCLKFVSWILSCICTSSFSFNIMGQPLGLLKPSRGLRQGDPLSPYLFIIISEALSNLIKHASILYSFQGIKISKNSPPVTHLFFADDSIFFCKADISHALLISTILRLYGLDSGQQVNLHKSSIFFSRNTPNSVKADIVSILNGISIVHSTRYLGLPLGLGRSKRDIFSFVTNKVIQRLSSWKNIFLSEAGKAILLNSVIGALPTFVMSCFKLPIAVCTDICRLCASFWWGSDENGRNKIHWASWQKLTLPKENGGLGFKCLTSFNEALLAKQLWRLITQPQLFMSKVLKGKYFPSTTLWDAQSRPSDSWLWSSWLKARHVLKNRVIKTVGNGRDTLIWSEPWIPNLTNFIPSTAFPSDSCRLKKVCDLLTYSGNSWDTDLIEQSFRPEEARHILSIPLDRVAYSDMWKWIPDKNGKFSVKSAYSTILKAKMCYVQQPESSRNGHIEKKIWKFTWSLKIKQKIKNFIWRSWFNFLSTQDQLRKKCIMVDPICCICGEAEESLEHIFFHCPRAIKVWKLARLDWSGIQSFTDQFKSWWSKICHIQRVQCIQDRVHFSTYILWWLWKTRNHWLFNKVWISEVEIAKRAWLEWREFEDVSITAA